MTGDKHGFLEEDELWEFIIKISEPYTLSTDLENKLKELVHKGVIKLKSEDSSRTLEVKKSFENLIEHMKEEAAMHYISEPDNTINNELKIMYLKIALRKLCPKWPIC